MKQTEYKLVDQNNRVNIQFDVTLRATIDKSVLSAIRNSRNDQSIMDVRLVELLQQEIASQAAMDFDRAYNWRNGGDGESAKLTRAPRRNLVLVYQAGLANVFEVNNLDTLDNRKRILQGTFNVCFLFCEGAIFMGANVRTMGCNVAGDCTDRDWTADLESLPFSDQFVILEKRHED